MDTRAKRDADHFHMTFKLDAAPIGTIVTERSFGPIQREDLRRYADASGDSNPLHLDQEVAVLAGFEDVIVHGMFGMALLGRLLEENVAHAKLLTFRTRFRSVININQEIRCRAWIMSRTDNTAVLGLAMLSTGDAVLIEGHATLVLLAE
jgi:acyl dehydratase